MTTTSSAPSCGPAAGIHPILIATHSMNQTLSEVSATNPTFMSADDKAAALIDLARVESRASELRLRILAKSGDLAEQSSARDAAEWFAHSTLTRRQDARADLSLAVALHQRYPLLQQALREGRANTAQAQVIARALDRLHQAALEVANPVDSRIQQRAEATLIEHCSSQDPQALARLGRRILEVVAPDIVDEAEARHLAALESEAHRATKLTLRRLGDGTTQLSGVLPDLSATRLATYLTAFTNPRQTSRQIGQDNCPWPHLPYPRRLGEALCQLLESIDPDRLPLHGGDATTVVVTVDLEALRSQLGTASVLGESNLPGTPESSGFGETITAAQARRLACQAEILPAVLDGRSNPLDLGRSRRLFSSAQRKGLLIRDQTCRAEGCDIPGTWAEAHHWQPWLAGGQTDLNNGVLLCSHHHHQAHDPAVKADRLANGDVRFYRRR